VDDHARVVVKAEGDIVRGRGFAYALYVHSKNANTDAGPLAVTLEFDTGL
jgi:hypothetical protein